MRHWSQASTGPFTGFVVVFEVSLDLPHHVARRRWSLGPDDLFDFFCVPGKSRAEFKMKVSSDPQWIERREVHLMLSISRRQPVWRLLPRSFSDGHVNALFG